LILLGLGAWVLSGQEGDLKQARFMYVISDAAHLLAAGLAGGFGALALIIVWLAYSGGDDIVASKGRQDGLEPGF